MDLPKSRRTVDTASSRGSLADPSTTEIADTIDAPVRPAGLVRRQPRASRWTRPNWISHTSAATIRHSGAQFGRESRATLFRLFAPQPASASFIFVLVGCRNATCPSYWHWWRDVLRNLIKATCMRVYTYCVFLTARTRWINCWHLPETSKNKLRISDGNNKYVCQKRKCDIYRLKNFREKEKESTRKRLHLSDTEEVPRENSDTPRVPLVAEIATFVGWIYFCEKRRIFLHTRKA